MSEVVEFCQSCDELFGDGDECVSCKKSNLYYQFCTRHQRILEGEEMDDDSTCAVCAKRIQELAKLISERRFGTFSGKVASASRELATFVTCKHSQIGVCEMCCSILASGRKLT